MRDLGRTLFAVAVAALAACSGGGSTPSRTLTNPPTGGIVFDPGTSAATCPSGTQACGGSGWCCPTGTACQANPANLYGCYADYCCVSGCAGTPCGAGCCGSGTSCVANPGGTSGCTADLCCSTTPDETCPADVAAQCAAGSTCLQNHSARPCSGPYACYLPGGGIGCPGEVLCPNGGDFCPSGTQCMGWSGVCPTGSTGGNYCCKSVATAGESCDVLPCDTGLSCVLNGGCPDQDPTATRVCKAACGGSYPVDCGSYCCSSTYPVCDAPGTCTCWQY